MVASFVAALCETLLNYLRGYAVRTAADCSQHWPVE